MGIIGDAIISGLNESIEYMRGFPENKQYGKHGLSPANQHTEVDVKAIREGLGLTQSSFASLRLGCPFMP